MNVYWSLILLYQASRWLPDFAKPYTHSLSPFLNTDSADFSLAPVLSAYLFLVTVFLPARRCSSAGTIAVTLCLCPCLSIRGRCSNKRNERINLLFGTDASFDQPYTVISGNRVSIKITVLSSGTFSCTPDFENFAAAYRSSNVLFQLSSRTANAQSLNNWTVVCQLSW